MQLELRALREHEQNSRIYFTSDEDDAELEKSIEENGIMHPIIINNDHVILSGHRRYRAAIKLGLYDVPVVYKSFKNADEELNFLITSNMYRTKTMEEKIREGQRLKEIMQRKGEKTRDAGGKAIGMSGRTFAKAEKVVEAIDAIKDSNPERAQELRTRLDKSVDGAFKAIEEETIVSDDIEVEIAEEAEDIERKRMFFFVDDLDRLTSFMQVIYSRLSKERNSTTPESIGHMIGNIYEMRERLLSWTPKRMSECPICSGKGQVEIPNAAGGTTVEKCSVCLNGKVGLYKASTH